MGYIEGVGQDKINIKIVSKLVLTGMDLGVSIYHISQQEESWQSIKQIFQKRLTSFLS